MKRLGIFISVMAGLLTTVPGAVARDDDNKFAARLSGYNEVLFSGGGGMALPVPGATLRGAVSTKARGKFHAEIKSMDMIDYELSYERLEADITQAHIHFGQRHTVGGIVVWLCKTDTNAPNDPTVSALTPFCPDPREGTVTGTITPAQVLAATGQGIEAGEFDEVIRAIRAGAAYANVHSMLFPQGEIRGQVEKLRR